MKIRSANWALFTLAAVTTSASATWSVLIVNPRTGEIGVASATCLTGIDLRAETPVLITGVGAATGQSQVDSTGLNRGRIRNLLLEGTAPSDILDQLAVLDSNHQNRQYGILNVMGETATFSGSLNSAWAGGVTGSVLLPPEGPENDWYYAVQGNLLTGAYAVDAAATAIGDTFRSGGDLPDALMAAMEAAFYEGGDGRCSCGGDVPSCNNSDGSLKSAHVGYMLVARQGDIDASSGFWDMGEGVSPIAIASADIGQDGKPDVIVLASTGLHIFNNSTAQGTNLVRLEQQAPIALPISAPDDATDLIAQDATGNGIADLLVLAGTNGAYLYVGDNTGSFAPPTVSPLDDGVTKAVLGNFLDDGSHTLEVAAISPTLQTIELYRVEPTPEWSLTHVLTIPTTGTPRGITHIPAADPGTGFDGLAIVSTAPDELVEYASDGSTLTVASSAPGLANPSAITTGDFNGDSELDLAASSASLRSIVLGLSNTLTPQRDLTQASIATRVPSLDLKAGDLDGDGDDDLLGVNIGNRSYYPIFNEQGDATSWTTPRGAQGAPGSQSLLLVDMNSDGLLDFGSVGASVNALFIGENTGTGPTENLGFAAGNYFLELNVPGQTAQSPDPVLQLRGMFDAWRQTTLGVPDAQRSRAEAINARAFDLSGNPNTVEVPITLRDHTGAPVSIDPALIRISQMAGDPDLVAGSTVVPVDPSAGLYTWIATLTGTTGSGHARVAIPDGTREIVLTPAPEIVVGNTRVDLTLDNDVNIDDVLRFLTLFASGDPAVDFAPTFGSIDIDDVLYFLSAFADATD